MYRFTRFKTLSVQPLASRFHSNYLVSRHWALLDLAVTLAVFVWASIDRMRMISFTGLAFSLALLIAGGLKKQSLSKPKA